MICYYLNVHFQGQRVNFTLPLVPSSLKCSVILYVLHQHVVRISKTSFAVKTPNRLILRDLTDLPILCEDNASYNTSSCVTRTGNVASKRLIAVTLNCCFLNKRKIQTFKDSQTPDGITFLAYESQIYSAKFHAPLNSAVQQCAIIK